jgi:hypothetical protein
MADSEILAATLKAAIIQTRTMRLVGQANLLNNSVPGSSAPAGILGGDPHEITNTVSLYFDVFDEILRQINSRVSRSP